IARAVAIEAPEPGDIGPGRRRERRLNGQARPGRNLSRANGGQRGATGGKGAERSDDGADHTVPFTRAYLSRRVRAAALAPTRPNPPRSPARSSPQRTSSTPRDRRHVPP